VSALCLFVDDLDPSIAGKPLRFEGFWLEIFVLSCVRVICDSLHSRE
jgi:hypothetical protein